MPVWLFRVHLADFISEPLYDKVPWSSSTFMSCPAVPLFRMPSNKTTPEMPNKSPIRLELLEALDSLAGPGEDTEDVEADLYCNVSILSFVRVAS